MRARALTLTHKCTHAHTHMHTHAVTIALRHPLTRMAARMRTCTCTCMRARVLMHACMHLPQDQAGTHSQAWPRKYTPAHARMHALATGPSRDQQLLKARSRREWQPPAHARARRQLRRGSWAGAHGQGRRGAGALVCALRCGGCGASNNRGPPVFWFQQGMCALRSLHVMARYCVEECVRVHVHEDGGVPTTLCHMPHARPNCPIFVVCMGHQQAHGSRPKSLCHAER